MKRNILWILAAVLFCGLAVTLFTQCNKENETNTNVKMMYYVSVSPDVLSIANVEINYLDEKGAKKKEVLTDTAWKKPFTAKSLPLTEGVWAKITPKSSIPEGNYQLSVRTAAAYQAKLANGAEAYDALGSNDNATTAQNAEQVAAWCAKSPTVAFTIGMDGLAQTTTVDFGGNGFPEGPGLWSCYLFCWMFDLDPEEYCQ